MMWLKACPRCRGDLFMDSDYYGPSVFCIKCGHTLDRPQPILQRRLFTDTPAIECEPPARASLSMSATSQRVA
jgi:hypothetical protein